jgi:hypothetical protein
VAIRQVAGTGYVFGAYTAVDWPNQPAKGAPEVIVSDPSGASFMFSLINRYDRPFRLSLIDRECALSVDSTDGPTFGADVYADGRPPRVCNLRLMYEGKDANEAGGNCANPHFANMAYQLDAWAGAPPIGFKLDHTTTLVGSTFFAAAEIEVYATPHSIIHRIVNVNAPSR